MADQQWPDGGARYEFVGGNAAALEIWQEQVRAALEQGRLVLTRQFGDIYHLTGMCPRCGHPLNQVVEFKVFAPGGARQNAAWDLSTAGSTRKVDAATVDVICSCTDEHAGRGEKRSGCGWGKGIPVILTKPETS